MKWLKFLIEVLLKFLNIRKEQQQEDALKEQLKEKQAEEEVRKVENEIKSNAEKVKRPKLDSSEDSDDPLGINKFNRG